MTPLRGRAIVLGMTNEITCRICRIAKPEDEFHRRSGSATGRDSRCKECKRQERLARYQRDRDLERERVKEWRKANPESVKEHMKARSSSMATPTMSVDELRRRDGDECGICHEPIDFGLPYLTGGYVTPGYRTIDHIIPVSRGGSGFPDNLRLAHFGCNSGRRDRNVAVR